MITTIGVDTGDTTGLVRATWGQGSRLPVQAQAFQCDRASAAGLLRVLLRGLPGDGGFLDRYWPRPDVSAVQIEAFDDRPRRGGLAGTSPSLIRAQVNELAAVCEQAGVPCFIVTASEMKNWATDDRLKRCGLLELTAGMPRHARDGGRHSVHCAVKHCGLPDPLSRNVLTRRTREGAGDAPG